MDKHGRRFREEALFYYPELTHRCPVVTEFMPAFLSSDQWNELTGPKAVIELQIYGFGLVTVDRNITCSQCGKLGHVQLPADVTGCVHCQYMDLSRSALQYEDAEAFRIVLSEVPALVEKAIAHVNDRYYRRRK